MNLNPFKMMSPAFQKQMVGGIVGSLSYWGDRAIADTQTWYPTELKGKLAPQLPRNDELIATVAPPVIMYALYKKNPSKFRDLAKGVGMYSGPQLLVRAVVSALGAPTVGMPLKVAMVTTPAMQVRYTQTMTRQPTQIAPSYGKYKIVS